MNEPVFISHYDKKLIDINDLPVGNPVVINTIQLLRLLTKLDQAGSSSSSSSSDFLISSDDLQCLELKQASSSDDYDHLSRFLSQESVQQLLKRSIILITTHAGFHETSESIIEILTQITGDYLKKLTHLLRSSDDSKHFRGPNDFIDLLNRAFAEIGLDLPTIQHYESTLRSYRNTVHKEVVKKLNIIQQNNSAKFN
ncbi:uncharacterized protein LOC128394610 [Panonychus citri]|uniref:uncharacterized protein LOC128389216 n=1 Tax=Panonychus citri TaxID=50023 RepID=UPI0023070584|nr:uncharacterized protein LOC128389216 [Panonychus citri]XP_053210227.1 uncharacterized protein LOC128394016 [Panonychus citri]XP_053210930.1 uncharacterized protein LOC128394610 [Panonychus citri]